MIKSYGQLTYCTNIHGGEGWDQHFASLRLHFPKIKQSVSPMQPMGIGLRLADLASTILVRPERLDEFKDWLTQVGGYVFTMNGFPFGAFHDTRVKEDVHTPDWTTAERLQYTKRLFTILAQLLPQGMDGGISTSPLGYRHWYNHNETMWQDMRKRTTAQIVEVAAYLHRIWQEQGKELHLDIEPEPDGVLETGPEFIEWFTRELVPRAVEQFSEIFGMTSDEAEEALKRYVHICYDVCHFALGYEHHRVMVDDLNRHGIKIGKFQISAALKARLPEGEADRAAIGAAFQAFDEPTYLHQVLAKQKNGEVHRFTDLPDAQDALEDPDTEEWRSHFHVPIFLEDLGLLQSTQSDIREVLAIQQTHPVTRHLEVETYTWGVLPRELQLPIADSISRELRWVLQEMETRS